VTASSSGGGGGAFAPAAAGAGAAARLIGPGPTSARRRAALLSLPLAAPPRDDGGLVGWASAQAWTASGQPPPRPLAPREVPAERVAAAALLADIEARTATLGTGIEADLRLLDEAAAAAAASRGGGGGGGGRGGRSSQDGGAAELGPRREAAVRARLEHKLMLAEAAALLRRYQRSLARG
jgi:hypothetical protein